MSDASREREGEGQVEDQGEGEAASALAQSASFVERAEELADLVPADRKSLGRAFYYQLPLERAELLSTLAAAEGVNAVKSDAFPEFGPPVRSSEFTATLGERSFLLRRSASERGAAGTGLWPSLFLRGRIHPSAHGSMLELRFAYGRPSWAWQRAAGLVLLAVLGVAWIFLGQAGAVMQRAIMVAILLLFVSPLILNDVARRRRLEADQRELLAFAERTFGALAIGRAQGPGPYRESAKAGGPS